MHLFVIIYEYYIYEYIYLFMNDIMLSDNK